MEKKINNLFIHQKKLKERDPEEHKKCLALTILAVNKLQHSTTEMGIYFAGFDQACKIIISYLGKKLEPPNKIYLRELHEKGFEEFFVPYCHTLFESYENWKRQIEKEQLDRGRAFTLFETSFNNMYKEFQRRKWGVTPS